MIHYTCDRCKRVIDPSDDLRYVVKLEVQAVIDGLSEEGDDDRDHLMEIHEILERAEDLEGDSVGDDIYQRNRFDLCPECYRRYIRNPLAAEPASQFNFSQN
jgi:hypothetical protein